MGYSGLTADRIGFGLKGMLLGRSGGPFAVATGVVERDSAFHFLYGFSLVFRPDHETGNPGTGNGPLSVRILRKGELLHKNTIPLERPCRKISLFCPENRAFLVPVLPKAVAPVVLGGFSFRGAASDLSGFTAGPPPLKGFLPALVLQRPSLSRLPLL